MFIWFTTFLKQRIKTSLGVGLVLWGADPGMGRFRYGPIQPRPHFYSSIMQIQLILGLYQPNSPPFFLQISTPGPLFLQILDPALLIILIQAAYS